MLEKPNAVLSAAYFIPLILATVLSTVLIATVVGVIVSHYPGLIELELKLGVISGSVKLDSRPPSTALPPGKQ